MAELKRPLFITCSFIFLLHQILQKAFEVSIPLADAYLDNFLLMPIVLTLWLAEKQLLHKKPDYKLSLFEIWMATIYLLVVTEVLFPLFSNRFTADAWDVAITAMGSLLYYLSVNKKLLPLL